eukprot:TRINITY_DN13756_c0_g1_i1.p1 TRINITY_DN13756_c0_g1~~TRINITY_DN13756_c0_g1_i1.p1  ORF type:complete len:354 (-),score=80.64 TRINITY_DN13756_c0_g1_i1:131-1099(-)
MILLEYASKIVEETLKEKIKDKANPKIPIVDLVCADFDGVMYHVYTSTTNKKEILISISIKCYDDLVKYGANSVIDKHYKEYKTDTEPGYNLTLKFNLDNAKNEELATEFAMLKARLFSAPYHHVFDALESGKKVDTPIQIGFRDAANEKVWLKTVDDRVMVIFSINFKDPDDIVLGKNFLSEFKKNVSGAPSVDFAQKDPPRDLSGTNAKGDGFVTFVLFKRHVEAKNRLNTIYTLQNFRNYLQYHIKCAKSHLHTRMRNRVDTLLKILNRAKQKLPTEKKTASGRTFSRKEGGSAAGGVRGRGRGAPVASPKKGTGRGAK